MNKNLVKLMKFIGESVDDIDFDKELGDYYGTGDTLDRFRAIFNQLNLGEYTDENIQKAIDHGNFSDNEKNFIWDTFAAADDDDYDEDYDTEELFESSIKKLCNVAGKPALAEAVMKLYKVYHPVMEAVGVPTESSDQIRETPYVTVDALIRHCSNNRACKKFKKVAQKLGLEHITEDNLCSEIFKAYSFSEDERVDLFDAYWKTPKEVPSGKYLDPGPRFYSPFNQVSPTQGLSDPSYDLW